MKNRPQTIRCPHCDHVFNTKDVAALTKQLAAPRPRPVSLPKIPGPRMTEANPVIRELARWGVGHRLGEVESETRIPAYMICSRSRTKSVAHARHLLMFRLRQDGYSFNEIGHMFGCDHSTVMAACKRIETEKETRDESEK